MANTGLFDVALPESISVAPLKTARPDARLLLPPPLPRTPALRPTGLEHNAAHSPSLAKPGGGQAGKSVGRISFFRLLNTSRAYKE